ncbi:DUF3710 domain-containing protein [Nonomuraea dietziae]|uniref:DUF3710 domain-containing protein n=1 Tax=Nonomuraea dietziae TaxID=65515 RepID=A0A7W5V0Z1_9ACTN|nr:DUF3710 domain-containing protein [Nonomuraea dietziae]MBB3726734.1 hypothetical protein [Nonomuraea dietziae]
MFRRRKREQPEQAVAEAAPLQEARESGPWDADEPHPDRDRVDLGGMRISVSPDYDVQVAVAGDQPIGVVVIHHDSALQLHAFAAPKRGGLWDEVRTKLAASVKEAGGTVERKDGPFGPELVGQIPAEGGTQPVRYLGVDGPRWFLRAVISGKAALDADVAQPLEDVIRDVVVVRGDDPMAPEEPILLRIPGERPAATAEQNVPLNPFRRGPEISELR